MKEKREMTEMFSMQGNLEEEHQQLDWQPNMSGKNQGRRVRALHIAHCTLHIAHCTVQTQIRYVRV